jgi:4,5-DOPA dioxygenase extradiol
MEESTMERSPPDRMPAIFVGHGSPMNALDENAYTAVWRQLGAKLPRPRAILAISAHWTTHGTSVTAMASPPTIHDFGGFPQALFDIRYPAPGDPALAARVQALLAPLPVQLDQDWGLDHGVWSVLLKVYPEADVPVLQLSLDLTQPASYHYELGARLAPLREEGVLLFATGNVVHNLRRMNFDAGAPTPAWARDFNRKVRASLLGDAPQQLAHFADWGPEAQLAVPTIEHFLPLLYVMGCRQPDEPVTVLADGIEAGAISMLSVAVGSLDGWVPAPMPAA